MNASPAIRTLLIAAATTLAGPAVAFFCLLVAQVLFVAADLARPATDLSGYTALHSEIRVGDDAEAALRDAEEADQALRRALGRALMTAALRTVIANAGLVLVLLATRRRWEQRPGLTAACVGVPLGIAAAVTLTGWATEPAGLVEMHVRHFVSVAVAVAGGVSADLAMLAWLRAPAG